MALTNCNDCGKEISTSAEACPNCGKPMNPVKKQTETVVTPTPVEKETFPMWVIFPIIIGGALLLFLLFTMMNNKDDNANTNLNVDVTRDQTATSGIDKRPQQPVDTTIDQPAPNPADTTNPPPVNEQEVTPDTKTEVAEDKGTVTLEAKVADKNGRIQAVKDEKFYLLDKDLESILRQANLESIQNQSLINSFGISVINPEKYKDFNKKALDAINDHIKYDVLTNPEGKAEIGNVEPKSYYLFGIHKVGNGFAIWSSPVTVKKGENKLQIQPQKTTEIQQ